MQKISPGCYNCYVYRRDAGFGKDSSIVTKRIHRFMDCVPDNWGDGYDNVTVMCTCENQNRADFRLPLFLAAPIKHRTIIHEPMLEEIHIEKYLSSGQIEQVTCGGESGDSARVCEYDWILKTREQCLKYQVPFLKINSLLNT